MFVRKIKRSIFNLLVLAQVVTPITVMAADDKPSAKDEMMAASGNLLVNTLNKYNDKINIKWVKGGFRAVSNGEQSFDIKALSVIKEYSKHVLFTQYGLSKNGDGSTLNAGLGFYQLLTDDIMVGANTFYDARTGTKGILNPFGDGVHKRLSLGGTIMTSQAGMFFNVYRGISDSIASYKVSDGYDFGINGSIPGAESVNLGVTHYDFNRENRGNKFKIEYKPNSLFTFGVEQDISDNPSASLYIETKYEFNKPLEEQLLSTSRFGGDVWSKRYNEVERDNNVTLELSLESQLVDFTMATPTSVPFETVVELRPLASGGGDGELSFEEVEADEDVTVGLVTGTVSSTKPAEVEVNVTRAALGDYDESTVTVTVIFTEKKVTLIDGAKDKGLLTSEQGEDEGVGVDLTKAIVMVGTGGVSYALKSDGDKENKSKMASSSESHPLGASVTEKGFVTATKAGTVSVVVSQKGDTNYDASELGVDVVFSKSSKGIEVVVPESIEWDKTVDLMDLVSGGGSGDLSFKIKEDADNTIGANVTLETGQVTALSAGTIEVTVKREGDTNYNLSTQDVTVTFGLKSEDLTVVDLEAYTGAAFTITGVTGAGSNATNLTYEKLSSSEGMGAVEVASNTGEITGVVNPGVVEVTAIRKQDNKYKRVTATVTIEFVDEPEKLTIGDQETTWGKPGGFDLRALVTGGQGTLSFAKIATDVEMDADIDIVSGVINAKEAGILPVRVTRGDENVEVNVTFTAQDGNINVTVPDMVVWGTEAKINVTGTALDSLKYEIVKESSIESADVTDAGILTAKEGGQAVVKITSGDKDYNEASETITYTFDLKTEDLTVVDLEAYTGAAFTITGVTGAGSNATNLTYEKLSSSEGMGTVEVISDTGEITGVENPGEVKVKAIRKQDGSYNRVTATVTIEFVDEPEGLTIEDQETTWGEPEGFDLAAKVTGGQGTLSFAKSVDDAGMEAELNTKTGVIKTTEAGVLTVVVTRGDEEKKVKVTFKAQDGTIVASVANAAIWGDEAQITVTGNGPDALTYNMVKESSIESAKVDNISGILTADEGGVAVVEITRGGDKDYNTISQTFAFTFDRKTEELSGLTDTRESVTNSKYSIVGVIGTDISDGDLSYVLKGTNPSDMGSVNVTPDTGEITGVTDPGEVIVTVTRAPNASYEQVSGDVTIVYSIEAVLSITDQEALDSQIWHETNTFNLADYIDGPGELEFTGLDTNDPDKEIAITLNGVMTAKDPGVFAVNVHRTKKDGYSEFDLTATVTFGKQNSTIEVVNPDAVLAGTPSQINVTGVGGQTFKYTKNTEKTKIEADVGLESGIVNSNVAGSVFVIVTHEGTEKYNLETQEVEVTFVEKAPVEFTINTIEEVESGEDVDVSKLVNMPEGVDRGVLSYAIDGINNIDADINRDTGHLTATGAGPIRIVVTREEDELYSESSNFVDIVFAFSGEDSKARLSLDNKINLYRPMQVDLNGAEVPGYKQISSYDIMKSDGYENYGQNWMISSTGNKDWNFDDYSSRREFKAAQQAQIDGNGTLPDCSYVAKQVNSTSWTNPGSNYIFVKDGATCNFNVTFFRTGTYKEKTVAIAFTAPGTVKELSKGNIYQKMKNDSAEKRDSGTKIFRKMNFLDTPYLTNPDNQDVRYTGSDISFKDDGSPWDEADVTDDFLEGLEKNCVMVSGDVMYIKEHSICYGKVIFLENDTYLSKLLSFTVTTMGRNNTSTFGSRFKFVDNTVFPGAEDVSGVYGITLMTGFTNSDLSNSQYTFSGPDVVTGVDGRSLPWNSETVEKINNVEKCIFVNDKNNPARDNRLLLIKKGASCDITVNFPESYTGHAKTEHLTITSKGLSPNRSTVGNPSYTARWVPYQIASSHRSVSLLELEQANGFYIELNKPSSYANDVAEAVKTLVYSGPDLATDSEGKALPAGSNVTTDGKDCSIISTTTNSSRATFYVRKGTTCVVDVTFPATDNFLAKTETLTIIAPADDD